MDRSIKTVQPEQVFELHRVMYKKLKKAALVAMFLQIKENYNKTMYV